MEQDMLMCQRVIEYRNAKYAISLSNRGKDGVEELGKHPELIDLLKWMHDAQVDSSG